jgi:CRP-like cAMP-binding protein
MSTLERIEVLRKVGLESLAGFFDEVCVPAGTLVAQEGRLCHEFVVVATGQLESCRQGRATRLGPGEALGWEAMRDRGRNLASVHALSTSHLLVMSHEQFRAADALALALAG